MINCQVKGCRHNSGKTRRLCKNKKVIYIGEYKRCLSYERIKGPKRKKIK